MFFLADYTLPGPVSVPDPVVSNTVGSNVLKSAAGVHCSIHGKVAWPTPLFIIAPSSVPCMCIVAFLPPVYRAHSSWVWLDVMHSWQH